MVVNILFEVVMKFFFLVIVNFILLSAKLLDRFILGMLRSKCYLGNSNLGKFRLMFVLGNIVVKFGSTSLLLGNIYLLEVSSIVFFGGDQLVSGVFLVLLG